MSTSDIDTDQTIAHAYVKQYRIAQLRMWQGKYWQIWRIESHSPIFYLPVFSSSIICSIGDYFDSLVVLPLHELLLYFAEYFSLLLSLMSILKYFHKTKWKDQGRDQEHNVEINLPDPDGYLSKTVLSNAIRAANESIEQLHIASKAKIKSKKGTLPNFDFSTVVCCWEEGGRTWSNGHNQVLC